MYESRLQYLKLTQSLSLLLNAVLATHDYDFFKIEHIVDCIKAEGVEESS